MTSRRFRAAFALVLAVLLVSMQRELPIHALTHAAAIALADQPALHATVDERCLQCLQLAAGENAVTGHAELCTVAVSTTDGLVPAPRAPAPFHRSHYRSRAPPALA